MVRRIWAGLLAIAAIAGVVYVVGFGGSFGGKTATRSADPAAATIQPGSIARIDYNPDSYRTFADDGKLELLVNDAGHIRVRDKQGGGFVWQSDPDTSLEPDLKGLWKSNADSPFMLDYVDASKQSTGVLIATANLSDAKTKTTVRPADGGAAIAYDLQTLGIRFETVVRLRAGYVEVSVPAGSIVESAGKQVVSIWPFPFFGAVQKQAVKEEGYMLVPLQGGAVVPMKEEHQLLSRVSAKLYGGDRAIPGQPGTFSIFPAFGMKRDAHSFLAVIEEGEYTATVHATPAGLYTSYHWIAPQFVYRNEYFRQTSKLGAGYKTVEKARSDEDRRLRYYFQSGDKADYAGMAADYRGYLTETQGMAKLRSASAAEPLPLYLTLYGGAQEKGLFSPSFVPATTFEQGAAILQGLHDAGVGPIRVLYNGWAKGGDRNVMPDVPPAEKELGGDKGLSAFVDAAQAQGDRVYLQADYTRSRLNARFVPSRDALKDINNKAQFGKTMGENEYVNPASVALRLFEENVGKYESLGVDGLYFEGFGSVYSDYRAEHPASRAEAAADYRKLLKLAKERLGSAGAAEGNGYIVGSLDFVQRMPIGDSYDLVATKAVPFLPIALHGLIDYSGEWGNLREAGTIEFLRSIEVGAVPQYLLTYDDPANLRHTAGSFIYSSRYEEWKETVASEYKRWNEALGPLRSAFIADHRELAPGVAETRYENGVAIVVNYNDTAYAYGGRTVKPLDFAVFGGGG
ncbi:DUF5696 domain-containing protein [Paenibacillus flagellatus]|uniref:Uncharacterized protein n=1 Tax=Paenibacillus flagellatus TaxID=2211139 RepID=A0A2V5K7L8_9BACL|nr:DUF5696 domain-containing protein [Paenibacillus flagellatus]PYI55439.1 hypothetical protein DLM86_06805 [Paenibacillus flagellatus]